MAHALDETYGLENAMVFAGQLPWHQHGTQIPPNLTVNEAIAACPAVDFETELRKLSYLKTSATPVMTEAEGWRGIVRGDTGALLGVATEKYSPIQIRDQWKGLDPLIASGLASIETLGSIQGGKRVWGLVKLNADEIPEWSDLQNEVGELATYALTLDDKTGSRSAIIAPTSVRVVCRNTLEAGISGLTNCVRVRHVGDTDAKIEAAAEQLWGEVINTYEQLASRYRVLNSVKLTDEEHAIVVQDQIAVLPTDPDLYSTPNRFKGAVKRAQAKRDAVHELWFEGVGHKKDRTAWEALNGAVQAIDHNHNDVFRVPKNGGKILSMMIGTEAQMKSRVTSNLLEFAQERLAA